MLTRYCRIKRLEWSWQLAKLLYQCSPFTIHSIQLPSVIWFLMEPTSSLLCQIHMQSCILAGGVAVGVSMPAVLQPWEAMTIGFTAAIISTLGFRYLKVLTAATTCTPWLNNRCITASHKHLFFRSTCCLHISAMTPVLPWAHMDCLVYWDGWHNSSFRSGTVMIRQRKDATVMWSVRRQKDATPYVIGLLFCRAVRFAVFHICAVLITIATSLSMGIITGKVTPRHNHTRYKKVHF